MLTLLHSRRTLRLTRAGRLLPWLGPALRGLVAMRFKSSVCRFSPQEQRTTWKFCKGCPHQRECAYGLTVEADPPPDARAFAKQDDGARPVVLSPAFPTPEAARAGTALPVLATFVGAAAGGRASAFWDAVAAAGEEGGLGPDAVGFRVEPGPDRWLCLDLPRGPEATSGVVPAVRVELTGPLMLRRGAREGEGRHVLAEPTFDDLIGFGSRALSGLCRAYGQPVEEDYRALREAARRVPTLEARYQAFRQGRWSSRSDHHGTMQGVTGGATYGPVPLSLVRWLSAAGLVHVGLHRVAGAGGWRVLWAAEGASRWHDFS